MIYCVGDTVLIKKNIGGVEEWRECLEKEKYIATIECIYSNSNFPVKLIGYDIGFCDDDFIGKIVGNKVMRWLYVYDR